jgi:hypothetical protein
VESLKRTTEENKMSAKTKENLFVLGCTLAIGVVLFAVPLALSYGIGKDLGLF